MGVGFWVLGPGRWGLRFSESERLVLGSSGLGLRGNTGALIISIGFWGTLYYHYKGATKIVLSIIMAPILRLLPYNFCWVLPGHGDWKKYDTAAEAQAGLRTCLDWMLQQESESGNGLG